MGSLDHSSSFAKMNFQREVVPRLMSRHLPCPPYPERDHATPPLGQAVPLSLQNPLSNLGKRSKTGDFPPSTHTLEDGEGCSRLTKHPPCDQRADIQLTRSRARALKGPCNPDFHNRAFFFGRSPNPDCKGCLFLLDLGNEGSLA